MIEVDEEPLVEFKEDIDDMSDGLEQFASRMGTESMYRAIERAVDREIVNPVLQNARRMAEEHVGERAQTIRAVEGRWDGNTYTAGITSDNEVVLTHEFGSGKYTTTGEYRIDPKPGNDKLAFRAESGRLVVVDYVMHPGVRGKRFMQEAMRDRTDEVIQNALDEVQQSLEDALE